MDTSAAVPQATPSVRPTEPQFSLGIEQAAVADRVITALAGPDARLRADQLTAIGGLLQPAARVLVVQATGWGKSAVYWTATALRRAAGAGPTLVVSPLLSLMRDQVAAAGRAGLRAATLNSGNIQEWSSIETALAAGDLDVILVSPERLANPRFSRQVLSTLVADLGLLVIDEAHAVSDWGHDFRPDYRRVADTIRELSPQTPVLATTATANARVTDDVATQLGEHTLVLRGPLARNSLQLAVIDGLTPIQRFGWVVEQLPRLPGSGIVYALTVADAQRLAEAVTARYGAQVPVAAYTGQLSGDEREQLEEALRRNEVKALIATSALGMGYDKPDLGFCVHVGAPPSPVSYYQQVGRAGRAIDRAVVVLLSAPDDAAIWDYFATASIPEPGQVQALLAVVPTVPAEPASVPALEAESGLRRTKVELLLKQLAVDGVVERSEGGWARTGREWVYDREHYDGVVAVRRREADIMRDYSRGRRCLMQLLQEALDDPSAAPCGRCSVCTGQLPDDLPRRPATEVTSAVTGALRTRAHAVEPRRMWPGGEFGSRGRIPAAEQAADGRALIHADAPEWREVVSTTFAADAPPSEELTAAVVALLSTWRADWQRRPELVIGLPAAGFAGLVEGLTARIAEIGRMERSTLHVDPAAGAAVRADRGLTSSAEAGIWKDAITVTDPDTVTGRVVLLVVDATSSLWPITIAADQLRRAGAAAVLPLLVHRTVG